MKRALFLVVVIGIALTGLAGSSFAGTYGGGSGTAGDPYIIATAEQMQEIGADPNSWDKHFILTEDIDLSAYVGMSFNIIGNEVTPFAGVFDGNGHMVSNFTLTVAHSYSVGLFGAVTGGIKDLGLIDPLLELGVSDKCGPLVGDLKADGKITNCFAEGGSITSGDEETGGLVGQCDGIMRNCYSTSTVAGIHNSEIGGLVGWNRNQGVLINCYSTSNILGDDNDEAGGLVGYNHGTILNCYSTGSVSGYYAVGGLVGDNVGSIKTSYSTGSVLGAYTVGGLVGLNYGPITNCYSTGSVYGPGAGGLVGCNRRGTISYCYSTGSVESTDGSSDGIGGLVGQNGYIWPDSECDAGLIANSYWRIDSGGMANMCGFQESCASGCDDSYGRTTLEMMTQGTFADHDWDFVGEDVNGVDDVWWIYEGRIYPRLWWEDKDPMEFLDFLTQDVVGLGLKPGIENSLLVKLDGVLEKLEDGNENNDASAVNSLEAFINTVEAQRGKGILEADADALIETAMQIIGLLVGE